MGAMLAMTGRVFCTLIGLALMAFAVWCAWFVLNAGLWSIFATLAGIASAGLAAFLGLVLTLAPWRRRAGAGMTE